MFCPKCGHELGIGEVKITMPPKSSVLTDCGECGSRCSIQPLEPVVVEESAHFLYGAA